MTDRDALATAPRRTTGSDRRLEAWDFVNIGLLVLVSVAISVLGVVRAPAFSALDEATHADYVWRMATGNIPAAGSELAPEVLAEWSCRAQDNIEGFLPPCGNEVAAEEYPGAGLNYNFPHPPLYYAISALIVRAIEFTPIEASFIDVVRLTGAAWLAAALVALYLVLRSWSVSRAMALGAGVLLAAVPAVAHASSIVTNDAPAALSGVLALWVLTRVALHEKHGWVLPTALTLAVAATKLMTAIAMISVAVVVAALAIGDLRRGRRSRGLRLIGTSVGMVGAVGAVFVVWRIFQAGRGDPDYVSPIGGVNTAPVQGAPFDEWAPTLFSAFGIADDFYLQIAVGGAAAVGLARLLAVVFTAAPFMGLTAVDAGDPRRLPAWGALVGALAVPLVVQVQTYVGGLEYFRHVSSRYALSLLPLTIATLVLAMEAKRWRWSFGLLAGMAIAVVLLSFVGVF